MEKTKQGRQPIERLILRPLAVGTGVVCVLLLGAAAAAAWPAARAAEKLWLLGLAVLLAAVICCGTMAGLFRHVSRKYLAPLAQAVEEVALAASGDLTGPAAPVPCDSREVEALLKAVGELSEQSTACLVKMEDTLKRMASGDFTARVDCVRSPECGGVCAALDGAVDRLRGAIGNVRTALEQITGPLDVLEQDAAAMEESAAGQQRAREGLVWSLERLDRQTVQRNDGSDIVCSAAQDLKIKLDQYEHRQEDLAAAIERINACTLAAGQIVKSMESASFQCSVLARTAYMEAASAGIDGKGFAVVASELRMLASRSAQSSQDAAAFMEEMNAAVRESAALASASMREAASLAEAGEEVCRKADGAAQTAAQGADLRAVIRQAAELDSIAEKDRTRAANAAQTAKLIKNRAGRLREALRAFKIN